jgi:surface antigen
MRRLIQIVAALVLVASADPAGAQINPFRSDRQGAKLSSTDLDLLGASINSLNRNPKVEVGTKEEWANPATGSHGSSEVTRVFSDAKRPCHSMHHDVFAEGRTPSRGYDLTWCRASDGKWKIKS